MPRPTPRPALVIVLALVLLATTTGTTPVRQGHGLLPVATPDPTPGGWSIVDRHELAIDGELVTLSPNGQWLAGIGPDDTFCVWEVATLDPTCDAPGGQAVDPLSLRWAPDSGAVAWTGNALRHYEDTDIMLFELAGGASVNLTDDAYEGPQLATAASQPDTMPVDVYPAWTPASQALVFARTDRLAPDRQPTDLMTIPRSGGEPAFLHAAHPALPLSVNTPIFVLADGTVLYTVASYEIGDDTNGVWRLDPDGEATQVMTAGPTDPFPVPTLVDVRESAAGTVATGFSRNPPDIFGPFAFTLDVDTGELTPAAFDPATGTQPIAVTFEPDGTSALALVLVAGAPHLVVTNPDGSTADLGEVEPGPWSLDRGIDWAANDTLLVPHHEGGGTLLTVAAG